MKALEQKTLLKTSEVAGIVFIVLLGSFLHFTYALSDRNPVVALFSAVNESVWEHLKLAFFPAVLYASIQYSRFRRTFPNFFAGKAVGIFAMPLIIVVGFYAYKAVFHSSNLAYDIGLFIASVIAGQLISYRLVIKTGAKPASPIPIAALAVMTALFFVFTFEPPKLEMFRDPVNGNFGIPFNAQGGT
ncbi:MAG: DUF6512 family protein [Candidatus Caldarchaeum sp.]|nr:DUF6512 family protein [Candidatus Caldarchaeum sp.]MDW8435761.1 DUF6512 family protein [Candidatus Caldarchaeum sp.]